MSEIDTSNMSEEEIAALQKQNCIFCKIASKEIPAKVLHEDDKVICVLDINPASEGHILVFPKEHYMILPHIPDDLLKHIFRVSKLMSNTLLKSLQTGGTSIFIANGMAAGQKAPHVLVHVFPRRTGDGLLKLPHYEMNSEQSEKLKVSLNPYFNQLFGQGAHLKLTNKGLKKEQIIEKTDDSAIDDDAQELSKDKEEVSHPKIVKHSNDRNVQLNKKNSAKEKTQKEIHKTEDKSTKKVNLDDIAKLFGG
ncbi:MAG: HIT family protein [Candidatus Woesearchaeota archaeon]